MEYRPADPELLGRVAFGRCRAAGATVEDAQDCAQEAIASLLTNPDVEHPKAWVATVAYRRYIDVCRLRGREGSAGLTPPASAVADPTGPEEEVVARAHARWLVGSMTRLPASTRSVCSALGHGMARHEVARRLGLSDRAVESHLTRARRALRGLNLLLVAAAVASWRALRRVLPASKPAIAAVAVSPFAMAVLIGAGGGWDGVIDRDGQRGAAPALVAPAAAPSAQATAAIRHERPPASPPSEVAVSSAIPSPTPVGAAEPPAGPIVVDLLGAPGLPIDPPALTVPSVPPVTVPAVTVPPVTMPPVTVPLVPPITVSPELPPALPPLPTTTGPPLPPSPPLPTSVLPTPLPLLPGG